MKKIDPGLCLVLCCCFSMGFGASAAEASHFQKFNLLFFCFTIGLAAATLACVAVISKALNQNKAQPHLEDSIRHY